MSRCIPFLALVLLLTGCASYTDLPAGTIKPVTDGISSPVLEQQAITVPVPLAAKPPSATYTVGRDDVLYINVGGHPELSSPGVGLSASGKVQGSRVDGAGDIQLPMVGTVHVAGLTVEQIQLRLEKVFARFLTNPWVVVEVADFKSQPVYLLGQFRNAGTYYLNRPLTLLQGLAMGGGLLDTANLRSARLLRKNKTVPVDIYRLIEEGSSSQNVWLQPGDTIFVPDDKNQNVFVFGAVNKPGAVPMPNGQLTLAQALSAAGLDEAGGNREQIRVIRSLSPTRGQLLVVDLEAILRGRALPFPLMEGDIVYAPRSGVGNWNQALQEILPSLQTISAVLQPFVQVKFLND